MHLIDICLLFWSAITQGFISVCWYLFAIYPAFNTDGYLDFVYLIVIDSAITEVREGASGPSARPVATAFFRRTNTSDVTWRRVPLSVWAASFDWRRHLVQTPRPAQPAAEGRNASRKRSRSVCSSYTASAPNRVPGGVSRRTIARARPGMASGVDERPSPACGAAECYGGEREDAGRVRPRCKQCRWMRAAGLGEQTEAATRRANGAAVCNSVCSS